MVGKFLPQYSKIFLNQTAIKITGFESERGGVIVVSFPTENSLVDTSLKGGTSMRDKVCTNLSIPESFECSTIPG